MNYARIQDGTVVEVINAFSTTEDDRPPAPEIEEGAEPTDAQLEMQRLHDDFVPGVVPMEQRFPPDLFATLVPIPDGLKVSPHDTYANGVFGPPAPPAAPTEGEVMAERSNRLNYATQQINPLQDLVDIGEATSKDEAQLLAWKKYRAAIGKVNTQEGFPADVVWPAAPGV